MMWIATMLTLALSGTFGRAACDCSERNITDKTVIVTGGARGIGLAIAEIFLENGAKLIIIVDKNQTQGEKSEIALKEKYGDEKVVFIHADVTKDLDKVDTYVKKLCGTPDVLVNNAGVLDEYNGRLTMETNLLAPMEWTMRFYEEMRKDKGGKGGTIMNMADIYSYYTDPFLVYFKTAYWGVLGFTKTMGHDYIHRTSGVSMITLNPGLTYTIMKQGQLTTDEYAKIFALYAKTFQWQHTEDVAKAVMKIFQIAKTGSAYTIQGGEMYESPDSVKVSADYIESLEATS